jgi:hypothetical protein
MPGPNIFQLVTQREQKIPSPSVARVRPRCELCEDFIFCAGDETDVVVRQHDDVFRQRETRGVVEHVSKIRQRSVVSNRGLACPKHTVSYRQSNVTAPKNCIDCQVERAKS